MLKSVSISELTPGMMVTRVIEQHGPVKIRRVGLIKSEAMVKGLTEMGVSLLEVDEAQSVTLEVSESPINATEQGVSSLTPTQRLMEKDKQSALVDRQLSQQFHRSLFMPAIDEMPSKWRLYFRPYALLCAFIVMGFALGFLAISIVTNVSSWFKDRPPSLVESPVNSAAQNPILLSPSSSNRSAETDAQGAAMSAGDVAQSSLKEDEISQGSENDLMPEIAISAQNQSIQSITSSTNIEPVDENEKSEEEPVKRFQTINGIVLNEGETVVGYGAAEDREEPQNSSLMTTQNNEDNSSLSADLLSRVNQAAAQLEAEQDLANEDVPEPINLDAYLRNDPVGPVMDLRIPKADNADLNIRIVRIDQLPPAILTQMPAMSFSAHMYASNPQDRWVRVNGRRLSEGDFIEDGLSIVEIESERIILAFKGERFTMNALSDW